MLDRTPRPLRHRRAGPLALLTLVLAVATPAPAPAALLYPDLPRALHLPRAFPGITIEQVSLGKGRLGPIAAWRDENGVIHVTQLQTEIAGVGPADGEWTEILSVQSGCAVGTTPPFCRYDRFRLRDVNGDGWDDLIFDKPATSTALDVRFIDANPPIPDLEIAIGAYPMDWDFKDVNFDGYPDVLYVSSCSEGQCFDYGLRLNTGGVSNPAFGPADFQRVDPGLVAYDLVASGSYWTMAFVGTQGSDVVPHLYFATWTSGATPSWVLTRERLGGAPRLSGPYGVSARPDPAVLVHRDGATADTLQAWFQDTVAPGPPFYVTPDSIRAAAPAALDSAYGADAGNPDLGRLWKYVEPFAGAPPSRVATIPYPRGFESRDLYVATPTDAPETLVWGSAPFAGGFLSYFADGRAGRTVQPAVPGPVRGRVIDAAVAPLSFGSVGLVLVTDADGFSEPNVYRFTRDVLGRFVLQGSDFVPWAVTVALANFDGDLFTDLAIADQSGTIVVSGGDGSGAFPLWTATRSVDGIPQVMVAANVDDGDNLNLPDLVVRYDRSLTNPNTLAIYPGSPATGIGPGTQSMAPIGESSNGYSFAMALGDLTGDGKPDYVGIDQAGTGYAKLRLAEGDGLGGFGTPLSFGPDLLPEAVQRPIAIGFIDPDTSADVAVVCYLPDSAGTYLVRLFNDGTGNLYTGPFAIDRLASPGPPLIADLDSDPAREVFVPETEANMLFVADIDASGDLELRYVAGERPSVVVAAPRLTVPGAGRLLAGPEALDLVVLDGSGEVPVALVNQEPGTVDAPLPPRAPRGLALAIAPNPARGAVSFAVTLPASGAVEADLYDLGGRRVATLARGERDAGEHTFRWDGRDVNGATAPAGLYLVRVRTPDGERRGRLVWLR
jgi:hypothetical protein